MPKPTAAPPRRRADTLPSDLDQLVREALAGGSIGKVKAAMMARSAAHEPAPASPSPASSASPPPAPTPPTPRVPPPAPARRGPSPAPVSAGQAPADGPALIHAAQSVAQAVEHRDAAAALGSLARVRALCDALEQQVRAWPPSAPAPAPVAAPVLSPAPEHPPDAPPVLPPFRQPWLLVVEGPGNGELAAPLAEALRLDRLTARLAALARHPKVVVRGHDPEPLRAAAQRVQRELRLRATVVAREELLQIGHPETVLAVDALAPLRLQCTTALAWSEDPAEARGRPRQLRELPAVQGVVIGEVVTRFYRDGQSLSRSRRGQRVLRPAGEQRRRVVDLHAMGGFVRLVQGVTDTAGLPVHVPSSAVQSFKGLEERPELLAPGAAVLGSRSCSPRADPQVPEGAEPGAAVAVSGWPDWEEHTRSCRMLLGLGPVVTG